MIFEFSSSRADFEEGSDYPLVYVKDGDAFVSFMYALALYEDDDPSRVVLKEIQGKRSILPDDPVSFLDIDSWLVLTHHELESVWDFVDDSSSMYEAFSLFNNKLYHGVFSYGALRHRFLYDPRGHILLFARKFEINSLTHVNNTVPTLVSVADRVQSS